MTVRIEEEADEPEASTLASNPLFGMWQDRDDLGDVEAHGGRARQPRAFWLISSLGLASC